LRGGLAAYHDSTYRFLVFGGYPRGQGRRLLELDGPLQVGMQSQVNVADNLMASVQLQRTTFLTTTAPQLMVMPAVHWQATSSLSLDAEGAAHEAGAATRLMASYDAPLMSLHAMFQLFGPEYVAPKRSDVSQVTLMVLPSSYYRLLLLAGRSTLGGHTFGPLPPAESRFWSSVGPDTTASPPRPKKRKPASAAWLRAPLATVALSAAKRRSVRRCWRNASL
jgi:hypothetical protein